MEIRLATIEDIEGICLLYNEFFSYNAKLQGEYYKAVKESGTYPKSMIKSNSSDIFIATENNIVMGLIHVKETQTLPFDSVVPHKYCEIVDLIVTASQRKKGIGSMLMDAAKQWSKARNLDYIELFVLSNAESETLFYESKGFINVSHVMRYTL